MTLPPPDILDALPHRPPFRFLTTVSDLKPQDSGEAIWRVEGTEAFFVGHFPRQPIVPGVLIVEALAQLSGLIAFHQRPCSGNVSGIAFADRANIAVGGGTLAHVDVRFKAAVVPPAEVALHSRLVRTVGNLHQFEVEARWTHRLVSRGRLTLADASPPEGMVSRSEAL